MMFNWVALFPEFCLLISLVVAFFVLWLREKATPKTFYSIAKYGVGAALIFTIVLFDQSFMTGFYENFAYTTLFKVLIYLAALVNMCLAVKYFLSLNVSSFRFYTLVVVSLLLFSIVISCANLIVLVVCLELGFLLNYWLILLENDDENLERSAKIWGFFSLIVAIAALISAVALTYLTHSSSLYDAAAFVFASATDWKVYLCCAVLLVATLYKLGISPFHFWLPDILGLTILPVSGYLAIVSFLAYAFVFIRLASELWLGIYAEFSWVLSVFALLSVVVGAIGANTELNMRKLLAYVRIFVLGIVFMLWQNFQLETIFSGFVFLLICVLTMTGVYTVFYGLKSKGLYLMNLISISGVADSKSFLSAALVFFLFSLLGFPPSLGFLGLLTVIHDLVAAQKFLFVAVILIGIVVLSAAFLRMVKSLYFDKKNIHFDRVDKEIYWMLFWILLIIVVLMVNPKYLMNDIEAWLRALVQ